jgi:DNA-binding transcriptional LysR family regulator
MDRFTTLTVFARVVANGSFAAAARQLNMSPAAVSTHIQALEARLGTRLLNRTTRSLALTEVGQVFYERSVQILAELEETERLAGELQKAPRGLLRVNVTPSFGDLHVAAAAADFTAVHPDISVELIATSRFVDLVEEGFDLAVRTEPPPESSLIARRIAPVRLVVCAAPAYLAAHGTPQQPADLAAHNCLRLSELSFRDEWCLTGADDKEVWVPVAGTLRANTTAALRTAALQGQGLVLLPTFLVGDDLKAGRLVPLLSGYAPADAAVRAMYPHGRHLSAKVRIFIDFLIDRFGNGNDPDWDDWRFGAAGNAAKKRQHAPTG